MSNALKLLVAVLLCTHCIAAQTSAPDGGVKAVVLQKNEGELRTRRPREGLALASKDFLLKIGPKTNGSKHLLVITEEIPPGAAIPKHKHHGEDEILLIQTAALMCGWETKSTTRSQARWYSFPPRLGSA